MQFEVAVERLRALDREERSRDRGIGGSAGEVGIEVVARLDDAQATSRVRGHLAQPERQVERSREPTVPRGTWPPLPEGEQRHVIGPVVVPLQVDPARDLRRSGEGHERDAAFDQARDIEMAVRGSTTKVAAPEERVRVQVHDGQAAMHLDGARRSDVRAAAMDPVPAPLDELGRHPAEGDGARNESGRGPKDPGRDRRCAGQAARHRSSISARCSP